MVEFDQAGRTIVRFGIRRVNGNSRDQIQFTLDEFLLLAKVSEDLEEFRASLLTFKSVTSRPALVKDSRTGTAAA